MEPLKPKGPKKGPEAVIQEDLCHFLLLRGWFTIETHGNIYQHGLPDVLAMNKRYGSRWIEVKNPVSYAFTKAQLETFPKMVLNGVGVWVLTAATDHEYQKLFQPCNWWQYTRAFKVGSHK